MIIALNQDRKYILATEANKQQQFLCPGCQERVILRSGEINQKHFAHQNNSNCATFSENETAQHLSGKLQLASKLQPYGEIVIEAVLPEINQRPDILIKRKEKYIAIEYQCSPISQKRLDERNAGYKSQNIHVVWLLGQNYFVKNMTQKTIFKFLAQNSIRFYLPDIGKFVYRTNFVKYDFERVRYTEKYSEQLSHPKQIAQIVTTNTQKQIYKLQHLVFQKRVDEKLVRYLYESGRLLLTAPVWIHQGNTFGLLIPNWHWRLLMVLMIEHVGVGHVVHQQYIIMKLTQYLRGDVAFKYEQIALIIFDLEQRNIIFKKGQYILVRQLLTWYPSLQEKLGKVRK
ncbi:competence protein CoiA [Leuconostoc rapi]|uniref:competence protein CoiA n=1 Tax=Leuconostoc rapi TaxID=1406906 RepID=UPI001955FAB7|nr:competence protein CoiA family protein [Leuconostoc rapi]MBM7436039.1 competence protein CoiA [Leuconostoc rapi]